MATSKIIFYYDVVCPFAYMTSTLVEDIARRAETTVTWSPVLLGIIDSCVCEMHAHSYMHT